MRKFTKRSTAVISGVTAIGAIAAGAVAYAAFSTSAEANAGSGGAEKFAPITLSGVWVGVRPVNSAAVVSTKLLPGESGDVDLTLTAPTGNTVQSKVTSIAPVSVVATDVGGVAAGDRAYCLSKLTYSTYSVGSLIILPADSAAKTIALDNAVKLDDSADMRCSGMTFPTKYTVTYEATRAAATVATSLTPNP